MDLRNTPFGPAVSIAIVVYIYVGTSSKKRCECLERLMNMNTTTGKSQYTIKLRPSRKIEFESGFQEPQFALGEK